METEIYDNFRSIAESKFHNESSHLQDLWRIPTNVSVPYVSHADNLYLCVQAALNALLTLFIDFTLALKHPLYWLYMIFVYPIVLVSCFLFEISLISLTALNIKGLKDLKHKIGDKWSELTSPIDLFDDEFFNSEENHDIIDEGVGALDKPYYRDYVDDDDSDNTHNCNLEIAQLLLFMSDIVYNRDASRVLKAKQKLDAIKRQPENCESLLQEVVTLLNESDEAISAQAKKWKLKYTTISELNSLGESFAGIFYSERHNFIVVTFKGTTIDNFEKWVTEMLFQRIDGQIKSYNGYHSMLHPNDLRPGPYATIIEGIKNAIEQIRGHREKNMSRDKKRSINIWVTGHSLGGAMATMFYARCINSPTDLEEHCVLRDAYTFGNPSIGNSEFAKMYMSALDKRDEVPNTLWRIVDDDDIMCKLPIGFYHERNTGKYHSLDNAHIGEAIRFYQNEKKPTLIKNPLITDRDKPVIKSSLRELTEMRIPVNVLDKKLPTFIKNNTTSRYAIAMALARKHLNQKDHNSTRTKSGYKGEIVLDYE